MGWIIVFIILFALCLCLLLIHGASAGRSEQDKQELDDEQMRYVSKKKKDKE